MIRYLFALLTAAAAACSCLADIVVTDDSGRQVNLKQPAKRVVALAPHLAEQAWSAEIGTALVAAVDYADYPKAVQKLPRVGNSSVINIESIVSLNPDLILAWAGANKDIEMQRLKDLGLTVYTSDAHNFDDISNNVRKLSLFSKKPQIGQLRADDFDKKIAALRQRYQHQAKVRILYQVWHDPLQSLNNTTLIHQVIELCGGTNIAAQAKAVAPTLSFESVLSADPEIIITGSKDNDDKLDMWLRFTSLSAVKNQQLKTIDPDLLHRHTFRIAEGATLMCELIDNYRQQRDSTPEPLILGQNPDKEDR
ncbi:cobalamin-binding protein [Agaribacterium haliotis]|uniref:cobalamin-binding protein n=1 Tax=Agaribacterium haliotis TaxID=2013869 RepID=UPI000BB58A2B|nr:cobalamin-binding protein [Agaribacterium haliotis]